MGTVWSFGMLHCIQVHLREARVEWLVGRAGFFWCLFMAAQPLVLHTNSEPAALWFVVGGRMACVCAQWLAASLSALCRSAFAAAHLLDSLMLSRMR